MHLCNIQMVLNTEGITTSSCKSSKMGDLHCSSQCLFIIIVQIIVQAARTQTSLSIIRMVIINQEQLKEQLTNNNIKDNNIIRIMKKRNSSSNNISRNNKQLINKHHTNNRLVLTMADNIRQRSNNTRNIIRKQANQSIMSELFCTVYISLIYNLN